MESLEYICESLVMALLAPAQATGQSLAGIPSRHHESNADAILDCVIVKAEAGEHQLDGLKCQAVNVALTYASGTATPAEADARAKAMVESVYGEENRPDLSSFTDLEFASIEPGSDSKREDGKKVRKRIITIPLLAKLAAVVDLAFLPSADLAFLPADDLAFAA